MTTTLISSCSHEGDKPSGTNEVTNFEYKVDRFADLEILHYKVPDFESLTLNQKKLIYFLSQAALEGRDILYDQNNKYNLTIRRTLEAVFLNYAGDRKNKDFEEMTTYLKRVWFSNGIHHHYATDKFEPNFNQAYFEMVVRSIPASQLPLEGYDREFVCPDGTRRWQREAGC